ncbi:MAG: taurine catabolism dioxygenase TauD [Candidatus Sedimenticola endophacoides]|uniref:Taurine catabolism dioxygenase TauD n=2 Tax=Candidatus Sedimenticola endophacoides TaxID=2548426 RepID=A0A6N4E3E6_9GAMM|nr:MAG: taurine catabolism dioxygenase TauD [Candidatus Sedimenticola endophacoides]OQX36594.1 MAG: taurine catabolism dioxygenase TauD [Candidatus Sedimenticola endophacoides]OQX41459.1 MAG: taurine catabolism dioxygenase TauD [Candidatus Sedimenticola endophacoides]PUD98373.1 MAG: taurine catabolism dioxygenase TauD [Candidatus Sedimenticola endophacoides]PUE01281.1 MAG: taurine catabolism dioxygenase TauD [Candidatus Sedimenticola endophacoides]
MNPSTIPGENPFDLNDATAYRRWREEKLHAYPDTLDALVVEVADPGALTPAERGAILERVRKTNMAIYVSDVEESRDKAIIRGLGAQLGLRNLDHNMCADNDAISSLTVQEDALHRGYIPYSDRPIAWHTDGYYNRLDQQIHALLLHCVQPAAEGGANDLLDHEILYIRLRDMNPDYIAALSHPQAMTIPANIADGEEIRPARSGPVFMTRQDGRLHMRYTDRSRSIQWRDDPLTREAVKQLKTLLYADSPHHFQGVLQPGQGLISNNVLHTRTRFTNGTPERLLYRARYFDCIAGS